MRGQWLEPCVIPTEANALEVTSLADDDAGDSVIIVTVCDNDYNWCGYYS